MSTIKTITINASNAASGVDLDAYFATYFQGLQTGASSYYGGTPDPAPFGYQNGTQVGFRYKNSSGVETSKQLLIEGKNLAYDYAHYGPDKGHGISGMIESVTFGTRDTAQAAGPAELTGVIADLAISGWSISSAPGSGNTSANPVYNLYNALRKAGSDSTLVNTINTVLDSYAQNIIGSGHSDTFAATVNDDTILGGGGNDMIDGGDGNDVAVFSGRRSDYIVVQNGNGSFTITDERNAGSEGVDTVSNVENFQFSDGIITSDNVVAQQGTITIDASGADGMDFEAFIRGGFTSGVEGAGMPVFDNSGQFTGEEMFIGYGASPADKYVFAHGSLQYSFGTHTVAGTINTIEYGTRGSGTYDSNGYFIGGKAQLKIAGLDLFNAVPTNSAEEAVIEANGPVHNFALAYMYGNAASADRLNKYADALDSYAQKFIGSEKTDFYAGTDFTDTISGGGGDDVIRATKGNDTIDGGNDYDQVIFSNARSDYDVTRQQDGSYVIALKSGEGATTLKNVEAATFSDITLDTVRNLELPGTPPKNVALSINSVLESEKAGHTIGLLSAIDAEGKVLTFTLANDAGGLFEIVGNELRIKGELDYETNKKHDIRVKVSDADGHVVFKDFSIAVGNVDEGPENISISKSTISETTEVGTRVGVLSADDPEGGTVTYSLVNNPGSYFKLTDGKLTLARALDYEKKQSHTITVQATDSTGQSTLQTFKIDVDDVTETKVGTARNDVLTGKIGRDKLSGGAGSDKLSGNGGNDYLYGGSGSDKLTGGLGADDLWGGSDSDSFIFKSIKETSVLSSGRDTIFDFSTKQKDQIDFAAIDANTTKGGNQAFSYIGTKAFGGKAGELRYENAKSDTYIHGDVNGDKVADFTIHLDDRVSLSKNYFIL
ncbi:cadherin domain-containing protein [Microvirga sp. CF3016]|uniref:cadherin domain-containing protein n=1 Tax=Microvirga sp. CF3016 TaxID=3110181 RepID=UPI002E76BF40|nr:cadherin domain-containing protein [Microvirga sp. CF3016]MEE1612457.1 cadherin domain-containing protein [Microvirga sp. CF3016]